MKAVLLIAAVFLSGTSLISAQVKRPTAKNAVNTLAKTKGGINLGNLVQIWGTHGQDQPETWVIIAREPRRPDILLEYQFRGGRLISQAVIKEAYTLKLTGPNIPIADVNLDSDLLFRLADREAKAARLGFDSVDYELRCRELSTEPIWVVNLRDVQNRSVGVIFVSAKNSNVIRRHWNQRPGQKPMVARREAQPANVQRVQPAARTQPVPIPPTKYRARKPGLLDRIKEKLSGGR